MSIDLNRMTRDFIVKEGKFDPPTIKSYIQSLEEALSSFKPRTIKEKNKLDIALQHIKEIKRQARRMEAKIQVLEEELKVLVESKGE